MMEEKEPLSTKLTEENTPVSIKKTEKLALRTVILGLMMLAGFAGVFVALVLWPHEKEQKDQAPLATDRVGGWHRNFSVGATFRNFTSKPTYDADAFVIKNNSFYLHGEKIQLIAGDVHYQRIHPALWRDRLLRMRAMGLNTIQTYIVWNIHEPSPGQYNFEGFADIEGFIELCQELDLLVLLRAGPFICGEWEFGGFPAWLAAQQPTMKIRTYDQTYIDAVDKWWGLILPRLSRFLVQNGGPVVMVQIENEYGYWGDVQHSKTDHDYMMHLMQVARDHFGPDIVLYTTDPAPVIMRGTFGTDEILSTVDFQPGTFSRMSSFAVQSMFNPPGMKVPMCSELYTGWVVNWGEKMIHTSTPDLVSSISAIIDAGGSFSLYMAHGGTNFGWMAGAGVYTLSGYKNDITSYDYNAPLSEEGRHNVGKEGQDKFEQVRQAIIKATGITPPDEPAALPVVSYGNATFQSAADVISNIQLFANRISDNVTSPVTMEALGQNYGFIAYSTAVFVAQDEAEIRIQGVNDRAHVFIDGKLIGLIEGSGQRSLFTPSSSSAKVYQLTILVENMGRINFRSTRTFDMDGRKGIVHTPPEQAVLVDDQPLAGPWKVYHLPFEADDISRVTFSSLPKVITSPTFLRGSFQVASGTPADTFVLTRGWGKGAVWVNGVNLGRFWEQKAHPQHTLYVPAPILRQGTNEIVVLELDGLVGRPAMMFVDKPQFDY